MWGGFARLSAIAVRRLESMRVENRPSKLFTVTPGRGLRMGLLIAAVLISVLVLIEIAVRPMRDLYGPLVWAATYEGVPLERVMQDLEQRKSYLPARRGPMSR